MKKLLFISLLLNGFVGFGQVVVIENNTSVGSCTPATQNVYFYKSGITGSFTVKLYQVIFNQFYSSGCNTTSTTEVASASGSVSPLALSIPSGLEETNTTRPFGGGYCSPPPPYNYYYRYVYYYLKIVSDVDNNITNERNFGIGGSCQTPGVANLNIPLPNICPGNNVTINFNHNGINVGNTFTVAVGSDFNSPLVSTTIAGNTATSATLTIPSNASNSSYGVRITTTDPVSAVTYNGVVAVNTSYCTPPDPPVITANPTTACSNESIALTATGCTGTVNWSDGGTGNSRNVIFTASTTLTATCTSGGTSGNSNSVPITINQAPSPPTASGVSINSGSTASITASGCTTYKWYEDSENGGGLLFTGNPFVTPNLTTNTRYGVACQSGSCISNRTSVTVTVVSPPAQPANFTTSTNAVCQGTTGVVYTVPNVSGVTYNWSYSGTGATINGTGNSITINFANNATSGTLSVTATNSAGTSAARTLVITVTASPSAPTASGVTINAGATASLTATGCSTYNWYDQATGGTALQTAATAGFTTPVLNANTTYYVACESGTCVSSRTSVLVTVTVQPPTQPGNFTASTASVCQGTTGVIYTVPNVNGVTYNWTYSGTGASINGTGNSITINFANNATSGTLSVTATNSAGTSAARTLAITVTATPAAPTASGVTINAGATASLTATGCSTYKWYDQSSGGTALQTAATAGFTTPNLYANITYYVSCANGSCESSRMSVLVTVTGGTSAVLVAHYPFCGNANDATANANNGTVNGATLIADRFGNANSAYNFDGNDFISTPNLATSNSDNWAMTAWVKPNSISQNSGTIMLNGFDNGSSGNGYGMLMADGGSGTGNTLTGLFSGVTFFSSNGTFGTNNIWYHITMTRVNGVTKFYINGVQTSGTSTTMPSPPSGSLRIGSMNGVRFWDGAIDDVKVYSSGLTTPEVQTIYANESVNSAPTITASSNSPQCVGNTINFTATGGNTYTWNGPNTFTATGSNPSIANVTALATGIYNVIGANSFGCTNNATTSVTISTSGTPTANGVTIASGSTASITASGCTVYKWYDLSTGGTLLFTGNPYVSPALTTNTTYYVACSDAPCPETSRTSVLVTVNAGGGPPQPGPISGSNVACQGRTGLNYSVTAVSGATSYTWTYSGTGVTFVGGINNTRSVTVDFSYSATSGSMSVTANNASGSSPASTMAITVSTAPPAPSASGVTIASGNTANLTATGCSIYKWYSQASGGTVTFTGQNFTTPPLTSTTNYYVACNPGYSCESPRTLVVVTVPCTQMISMKTGAWNDPTVWSCNRIPTATDNIIVDTGHIVTIPVGTFQVKNITERGTLTFVQNGILNIVGGQ